MLDKSKIITDPEVLKSLADGVMKENDTLLENDDQLFPKVSKGPFSSQLFDGYMGSANRSDEEKAILVTMKQYMHAVIREAKQALRAEMFSTKTVLVAPFDKNKLIVIPEYATTGASGMDVRSSEDAEIPPGQKLAVCTNLSAEIPVGYEIQVRSRSGLAAKFGVFVLNSPGTIDSDYRGEIKVILHNTSKMPFPIFTGDRIAQLVLCRVEKADIINVEKLDTTIRGVGGFGSTGQK